MTKWFRLDKHSPQDIYGENKKVLWCVPQWWDGIKVWEGIFFIDEQGFLKFKDSHACFK